MIFGIVFDHLHAGRGGAEAQVLRLARSLAARGVDVRVYARTCEDGPFDVRRVEAPRWPRGVAERSFARRAVLQGRDDGCDLLYGVRHVVGVDIYHPHGGTWQATMEGRDRWRPPSRGEKAFRSVSGRHRWFEHADRAVFATEPPPRTWAVSPMVARDVERLVPEARPTVRLLWPALPDVDEAEKAVPEWGDGIRLLFVAHHFAAKGLSPTLQALARLRGSGDGAQLVVLGRGDARPFRREAEAAGRVRFLGARADVAAWMRSADVVMHPTFYDPCALVTLEAHACGTPVVTSRWNGAAPKVAAAGGQVVDDPNDIDALVEAVGRALDERPRALAGSSALRHALRWSHHVDEVVTELERHGG